jgi:hypothetical protein
MTPEERQLLTSLAERVRATPVQQKDDEADGIIRDMVAAKPDTTYVLTQTVLVQDFALRNAKAQIDALQQQLADAHQAAAQQAQPKSFLSGLFGGGTSSAASSVPQSGSWARQAPPPPPNYGGYQQQPQYQQPPQQAYAPQGGFAQPPSGTSSFLHGAAQTAVGVAGGALLFEGIESLFGGGRGGGFGGGFGGSPWGGGMPQETVNETVINNYNDGGSNPNDPGFSTDQGGFDDTSFDSGTDNGGFDDTDFGGGGNDDSGFF